VASSSNTNGIEEGIPTGKNDTTQSGAIFHGSKSKTGQIEREPTTDYEVIEIKNKWRGTLSFKVVELKKVVTELPRCAPPRLGGHGVEAMV